MMNLLFLIIILQIISCTPQHSSSENMQTTLLKIGKAAEKAKRYPYAINVYQEALKLDPKNIEIIEHLAINYSKIQQFDKTSSICKVGIKLSPQNSYLQTLLINSSLAQNKANEAIYWINQSLQQDKNNTSSLNALGMIFDGIEQHTKAQRCYKKALKLMPNDKQSLNNFGLSLALANHPQHGIEKLIAASTLADSKISEANINLIKKTFAHNKKAYKKLQHTLFKHPLQLSKISYKTIQIQWLNFCR